MEAGFIGIGALLIVQLVGFTYGYGKLTQKVNDICRRLNRIEKIENGGDKA